MREKEEEKERREREVLQRLAERGVYEYEAMGVGDSHHSDCVYERSIFDVYRGDEVRPKVYIYLTCRCSSLGGGCCCIDS